MVVYLMFQYIGRFNLWQRLKDKSVTATFQTKKEGEGKENVVV